MNPKPGKNPCVELLPGLYLFSDDCNVYLLKKDDRAIAIDFGSGRWIQQLGAMGIRHLDAVFLTHHHVDQCGGLTRFRNPDFKIVAPAPEKPFLEADGVDKYWKSLPPGCPPSYSVLKRGIAAPIEYFGEGEDWFWGDMRIRALPTPGHGPVAHSFFITWQGKEVCFCGDAAHAEARLWEPYHLEWSHWLPDGAIEAWNGINRLSAVGMDLLCPSHGPAIREHPNAMLKRLAVRLQRFYEAKLSICAGERDDYLMAENMGDSVFRVLPHLYNVGGNGYLLLSKKGGALVVDPDMGGLPALEKLLKTLGHPHLEVAISSHYHFDHNDAVPFLRKEYGMKAFFHPKVADPLFKPSQYELPFLPSRPMVLDGFLPQKGNWRWNEYLFRVAHFPGQTWYHAAHMATIDGKKVFFGGDSFQPPSRWNGTGGFCAYNRSHFTNGFARSAQLVLDWAPDLLCNGHNTFYRFHPSHFQRIRRWALAAEKAVRDLCPGEDMLRHYYQNSPYGKKRSAKQG